MTLYRMSDTSLCTEERRNVFSFNSYLSQRQIGKKNNSIGFGDKFSKGIYCNMLPNDAWDHNLSKEGTEHGGVFNLEFSPDGSMLAAACEKRSILLLDPLTRKLIHSNYIAHLDCVNCVRFLDCRTFATCSDDSTVALWDARHLKNRIRTLHGHSNWVKNIEFSPKDGLLVTSGFDGSIYTWDINNYTENGFVYDRVFKTSGLMRTRLTPDASKMIISTTGGYLIIIHDLDLKNLEQDLSGFKPNMYRLMQLSHTTIPVAASFTNVFTRTRNRVEFVVDFPRGNEAEVISSLQVHPQGWCVLTRNISNDEESEWTCVHDIQAGGEEEEDEEEDEAQDNEEYCDDFNSDLTADQIREAEEHGYRTIQLAATAVAQQLRNNDIGPEHEGYRTLQQAASEAAYQLRRLRASNRASTNSESSRNEDGGNRQTPTRPTTRASSASSGSSGSSRGSTSAGPSSSQSNQSSAGPSRTLSNPQPSTSGTSRGASRMPPLAAGWQGQVENTLRNVGRAVRNQMLAERAAAVDPSRRVAFQMSSYNLAARTVLLLGEDNNEGEPCTVPPKHLIHKNRQRLLNYSEEPNVGRGFIKELSFSPDGRIICSPYGYGVRLLSFNRECSELSHSEPDPLDPMELYMQMITICHKNIVVSTKFSPTHSLLVTGCLDGKIIWHEPKL